MWPALEAGRDGRFLEQDQEFDFVVEDTGDSPVIPSKQL
jgi:hypothetical protein